MKIYTENQVSNYAHSVGEPGIGVEAQRVAEYGKEFNQTAETYEKQAKGIYSSAVKVQWQNSVNELMNNPEIGNNPQKMEAEIKKLNDKMSSEIVDDDVKVDFMANSILNSRAYINHARNNFIKIQNEREKSNAFNSIYAGMDLAGVSALNILSGGGNDGDIDAYMNSRDSIILKINSKYPDGTYMFSDEQRLRMVNDFDKNVIKSFKAAYDNASDDQKDLFYKKIMSDDVFVVQSEKGPININAKEVLTPTMMKDVKNYVRDERNKYLALKKKENEYKLSSDIAEYNRNPTKTGLEYIKKTYKNLTDKQVIDLEESYRESGNYILEDKGEALGEAQRRILEMASMMDDDIKNKDGEKKTKFEKRFNALVELNKYLNTQYEKNGGSLNDDDLTEIRDLASMALTDQVSEHLAPRLEIINNKFLRGIARVGKYFPTNLFSENNNVYGAEYSNKEQRAVKAEVSRIASRTWKLVNMVLTDPSLSDAEKEKQAGEIYKLGSRMVIDTVNPEVIGKNIDDTFSKNGITYRIVGFDNFDVQAVALTKGAK